MPLNATNFVANGHLIHQDLQQFVDLFTGVMTDQPVTFGSTLTLAADPTLPLQAVTKQYADTKLDQAAADARYLQLTGGTLSGNLLFSADNTVDIGASGATRPRSIYAGTGVTSPVLNGPSTLLLQAGGTSRWQITAAGNFVAQTDATNDIGANGSTRPRSIYASNTIQAAVGMAVGGTSFAGTGMDVGGTYTNNPSYGVRVLMTLGASVTGYGVYSSPNVSGAFTVSSLAAINAQIGNLTGGATATNAYGLWVQNVSKAQVTNAYGVYIFPQSAATTINIGLYNGGTTQLNWASTLCTNTTPVYTGPYALTIGQYQITNAAPGHVSLGGAYASTATTSGTMLSLAFQTAAAAFTMPSGYGINIAAPVIGAGSAVTTLYGINLANLGAAGVTNAYGIYIAAQSGASTTNMGLYNAGSTQLDGGLTVNGAVSLPAGSITSAMILDGTIATADLAAHSISQTAITGGSGTQTTTSSSSVDIPGMAVTLTTTGGDVLVWAMAAIQMSNTSAIAYLTMRADAGAFAYGLANVQLATTNALGPITAIGLFQGLAAGSHTFKLGWNTNAGTLTLNSGFGSNMMAVELKK